MNKKAIAVLVIAGLTIGLAVALRSSNRADAAVGDCYAPGQGPATPTLCE